jgi:hypothetical protein
MHISDELHKNIGGNFSDFYTIISIQDGLL